MKNTQEHKEEVAPLSDQRIEELVENMKAGNPFAMSLLDLDTVLFHNENMELIEQRNALVLRHFVMPSIPKQDRESFLEIALRSAYLNRYETAFPIIDALLDLSMPVSGWKMYTVLQNSPNPEIKNKAHYYLDKAAEGDYFYARKRKFALKIQWLGPIGMVLRWLHTAYLAPKYYAIVRKNKLDPRMAGTREGAEEAFDRLCNKVKSLKFWA